MPIYEFICQDCGEKFEKLVRSSTAVANKEIACPKCESHEVKKKISTIANTAKSESGSIGASGASAAASCAPGGL